MTASTLNKKIAESQLRLAELEYYVGHTPVHEITRLNKNKRVRVLAKMEWMQFGGSVKARPAYNILREALSSGKLNGENTLLDASSGNTGIAYAIFCAVAGIDLTLCIPSNASADRKTLLKALKANVIYTDAMETTDGSRQVAIEMLSAHPDRYYYADQYSNENNWKAHYKTTAPEIWEQTQQKITHFVSGLGTTGTFSGTGKKLKELNPDIQLIGLQPETALHGLEGWKHLETVHVPDIFKKELVDRYEPIDTLEAYEMMKDAAKFEGLMLSPSAAANLAGALRVAEQLDEGVVVTVFADDSSKYSNVTNQIFNA